MILEQPSKREIHTFFDIVNLLAGFEHANFQRTGNDLFPGIPRPTPEVVKVMTWLRSIIDEPEVVSEKEQKQKKLEETIKAVKKQNEPWNKGKKKSSQPKAEVVEPAPAVLQQKVPTPEELPPTVLKPGKPFNYADEVPDLPILVDEIPKAA